MTYSRIAFVGCGLIGGSLAKTVHRVYPEAHLHVVDPHASVIKAESDFFETVSPELGLLPVDCDLVFVAVPIEQCVAMIRSVSGHVQASCVITEVSSVKAVIAEQLSELSLPQTVILGHPMAGKEVSGYEASTDDLFEGKPYILSPQGNSDYETFKGFIESLNCKFLESEPEEHDRLVGWVSHLPYLLACSCVGAVLENNAESLTAISNSYGPGFRDTTRVASSSVDWGVDVCKQNPHVLSQIDAVITELTEIRSLIETKNWTGLRDALSKCRSARERIVEG